MTRLTRDGAHTPADRYEESASHAVDEAVTRNLRDAFAAELDRLTQQHDAGQRFEVLHYPGDLTDTILSGQVLGADRFGRPYQVLDAELDYSPGHDGNDGCGWMRPDGFWTEPGHFRTVVHLQYATPQTLATGFAQLLGGAR